MTHPNAMSGWLRLSVALLVVILPGLLASPLEAVNLLERGMLTAATKDPLCKDQLTSCESCNKIRNCVKIGKNYFNTGTPTECVYGTPWCAEENGAATCVATAPTDSTCNKPKPADFVCTQTGYFPDMLDCTKYYVCVEDSTTKELLSYAYDCSAFPDVSYDAATARCKLGRCNRLSCPHLYGATFQQWGQAPWIYASCMDSDPKNALVAACPHGQAWDGENCVQACQEEGRFADMTDNTGTRFIECAIIDMDGKLSEAVRGECPPGAIFSTAESICVDAPAATTLPPTTAAPATTVPATAAPATTAPTAAPAGTTAPGDAPTAAPLSNTTS